MFHFVLGQLKWNAVMLMKWLGENHFNRYAYFNFDERPELMEFFKVNKDIRRIISSLSLISGVSIDENSLIIFDEIQECPEALNSLKYFSEKSPHLPVISAGSLLKICSDVACKTASDG